MHFFIKVIEEVKRRNEGKEVRRLSFVDAAVPVATGWRLEVW